MKTTQKVANWAMTVFASVSMFFFSMSAHAYLPDATVLDPLYAEITTDINTLATKAWPIVFLVTGLMIAIGLTKTFTRRAAS